MLFIQLIADGLVNGCAIGVVAITFTYVYTTTGVFHVAHAGIFTLGGYLAWYLSKEGIPFFLCVVLAMLISAAIGAAIEKGIYERLLKRQATPLVQLIASLGLLAVLQNFVAILFTPNVLQFESVAWRMKVLHLGPIDLTIPQALTVLTAFAAASGLIFFSTKTNLGRRIRAVASNRTLAEITRLKPFEVYVYVMAISSALVVLPSVFIGLDQAMQPYNSVLVLLTAVIAVISGGLGSIRGAFSASIVMGIVQNAVLIVVPGRWSIALTFTLFIVFILFRPTGLFATKIRRAS
jgi:branched-chain amino acid transport system permease protein